VSNLPVSRHSRRPWVLVVLPIAAYGLLAILILGAVALGFEYAHADSRANAYAAAGPCQGSQQSGCILDSPVVLLDAGERSGRSTSYWFEVAGNAVPDQTFDLDCSDDEGFFMAGQGLGTLTAKSWDGTVISLAYQGATCGSDDAPTSKAQLWLTGLGVVASPALGWLTLLGRRLVRSRRGRWVAGTASAPFFMNVLIFPILAGAAGSHSALSYLPAYAVGAVIAVPIAVFATRSAQRQQQRRAQAAAAGPGSPSYGSKTRRSSPEIHWYGSESGSPAAGRSGGPRRFGRFSRVGRSKLRPGPGSAAAEPSDSVTVAALLEHPHRNRRIVNYSLLGLAAAGALTLLGFYIPAQANAFAYENAPICAGSATAGCIKHETATVVDAGSYQEDSSDYAYWIEIKGPGIPDTQFNLGGGCPACIESVVKPGGTISVQLWKGSVVELDADYNSAPGPTTPPRSAAEILSGVYALFGVVAAWLIFIAAARTRSMRLRHVYACTAIVVLFGACFAFAPLLAQGKPVLWALPLTLLISAFVIVLFYLFILTVTRRSARKRIEKRNAASQRAVERYRQQRQGRSGLR
jgi:hypothetical protein